MNLAAQGSFGCISLKHLLQLTQRVMVWENASGYGVEEVKCFEVTSDDVKLTAAVGEGCLLLCHRL